MTEYRRAVYRLLFGLAAAYSFAFGAWAVLWPQAFFRLCKMPETHQPAVWQCLGMVIGVYGVAYAIAAVRLESARPLILVGLLGKVLGPIGWALSGWPPQTFVLIVFNDLVWWLPFALFLLEGRPLGERLRALAPEFCAATHIAAALGTLLLLRPGTEVEPSLAARAAYISAHRAAWIAGWGLWMLSAVSVNAFFAWWGARARWGLAAVALTCAANVPDLLAESLFVGWLPGRMGLQAAGTQLTGGLANGLYTLAAVVLTLGTADLPWRPVAWTAWGFGAALSVCAVLGSPLGMAVSTAGLMALFIPFTLALGRSLR